MQNDRKVRIIPTSVFGIWCLLILNTSCSRHTASFTSNHSYPPPVTEFIFADNKTDSVISRGPELLAVANKEILFVMDDPLPHSGENRNELKRVKKYIKAQQKAEEIIQASQKEPVNDNSKKNGFAVAGFIFSALSVVFLLVQSPLFLLTLPLAFLFSILGLRSKQKTLSITGLIIAAALAVIVLIIIILFMIYSQQSK